VGDYKLFQKEIAPIFCQTCIFLVFIIHLDVIIHVFLNNVFRFRHRLC